MKASPTHPSFLELDRYTLGAARFPRETAAHIESCARCQEHVRTAERAIAIPAWVREAADSGSRRRRERPRRAWLWGSGFASGVAVAAALALFLHGRDSLPPVPQNADPGASHATAPSISGPAALEPAPGEHATTAKGAQAVGLYIKRGHRVFLWDGSAALQPGDSLRLKVIPGGFGHVAVWSETPGQKPSQRDLVELYAGPLDPDRDALLPAAWNVDDSPGSETLIVVLSDTALAKSRVESLLATKNPVENIWIRRFVVAKNPSESNQ